MNGKKTPNKGMQLTPSSAVFQITFAGYANLQLRYTLAGESAWVS
jgi:hypothetical protein